MERNQNSQAVRLPLNLQLFAEERTEQEQNEAETGAETTETEAAEGGTGSETPTFDELLSSNKSYQSAFDAKITSALNKAKKKWEQQQADEADEAKKLAKMSESEREKYQLSKEKSEFAQEKAEFERERLKTAVGTELLNRSLPASFAEFLTGDDAGISKQNIDAFEKAFNSAVSEAKEKAMQGKTVPKAENEPTGGDTPPEDFHAYEKWRKEHK
ncbi:MAG: DUF4355 domain-containing protein [Eubacterium sp.]|nr:DUF4355 domain-containing protein [Eubacterium sp.]